VTFQGGSQGAIGDRVQVVGAAGADLLRVTNTELIFGELNVNYTSAERLQFDLGAGDDTVHVDEAPDIASQMNGGTGQDTLFVHSGVWTMASDAGLTNENLHLVVDGTAVVIPNANQRLASLTLNDNSAFYSDVGTTVVSTAALSIAPTALLDLIDNNLVFRATAQTAAAALANITNLVRTGRAGGAWNGLGGIGSLSAAGNPLRSTTLAAILNNRGDGTVVTGTFEGQTVGVNDILVKYTFNGDANVDGKIDGDDYALIDNGYATGATGYRNGDFDYSGGAPDADDYFWIDKAHFDQSAPLSPTTPAPALGGGVQEQPAPTPVAEAPVTEAPSQPPVEEESEAPGTAPTESPVTEAPAPVEEEAAEAPAATPPAAPAPQPTVTTTSPRAEQKKKDRKKNRHHRRNVLDEVMPVEARMFLQRRRD
jgi:hypothetical protein